jgi:hypothetical protein
MEPKRLRRAIQLSRERADFHTCIPRITQERVFGCCVRARTRAAKSERSPARSNLNQRAVQPRREGGCRQPGLARGAKHDVLAS